MKRKSSTAMAWRSAATRGDALQSFAQQWRCNPWLGPARHSTGSLSETAAMALHGQSWHCEAQHRQSIRNHSNGEAWLCGAKLCGARLGAAPAVYQKPQQWHGRAQQCESQHCTAQQWRGVAMQCSAKHSTGSSINKNTATATKTSATAKE